MNSNLFDTDMSKEEIAYNKIRLKENAKNGHDPKTAVFRSNNTSFFTNSKCVFIEYCDGLSLPWLVFLSFLSDIPGMDKLFDLDQIRCLDEFGLMEWYLNRKHRNPLYDLCYFDVDGELTEDQIEFVSGLDDMLEEALRNKHIYEINLTTNAVPILHHILTAEFVPSIVVYHPVENEYIKEDIHDMFGNKAEFKTGDIEDVLKEMPDDSMYIFSNAEYISILEDVDKLDYSAILAIHDYDYNWISDEQFLVNFEELEKDHVFKYAYFAACSAADINKDEE